MYRLFSYFFTCVMDLYNIRPATYLNISSPLLRFYFHVLMLSSSHTLIQSFVKPLYINGHYKQNN